MLVPSEFARLAVVHGTVATVSDPHEIANVLGVEGIHYMIDNGRQVPFKFYFGAPSCVPATIFETAGATIDPRQIEKLFDETNILYLAEMMNWPGVLQDDAEVMEKIAIAKKHRKPIDGHAPGLHGDMAKTYAQAGISTDHECFTAAEAQDKLKYGMKILIREGSAAKNFDALHPLLHLHADQMMFCSDDKHPDNLVEGHINLLVKRALREGVDLFKILKAACINPVEHYKLDVGLLKVGDAADFIVVDDLTEFKVKQTYIAGELVAEDGKTLISKIENKVINNFNIQRKKPSDFAYFTDKTTLTVIEALEGQLVTNRLEFDVQPTIENIQSDLKRDLLKVVVVNRYKEAPAAVGFIKNFQLKEGAIASSVAHDSHNIIAVGVDDDAICKAVNLLVDVKGGICAVDSSRKKLLALPVAGLMSADDGYEVAQQYAAIDKMAKEMGSTLDSPFMTLSFMALLVIPTIKLSDLGLFNGEKFEFIT